MKAWRVHKLVCKQLAAKVATGGDEASAQATAPMSWDRNQHNDSQATADEHKPSHVFNGPSRTANLKKQ